MPDFEIVAPFEGAKAGDQHSVALVFVELLGLPHVADETTADGGLGGDSIEVVPHGEAAAPHQRRRIELVGELAQRSEVELHFRCELARDGEAGETDELVVVRMSHTRLVDRRSTLHFEYLVGTDQGIQRLDEVHELGLFTREQMASAFTAAGLTVRHEPDGIAKRGLYVGRK